MGYKSIDNVTNKTSNKLTSKQELSKIKEHVDISKNTRRVTFENAKTKNNDNETNKEKNSINDKKDKNMQVMNVSHGEISLLTVEITKKTRKKYYVSR